MKIQKSEAPKTKQKSSIVIINSNMYLLIQKISS